MTRRTVVFLAMLSLAGTVATLALCQAACQPQASAAAMRAYKDAAAKMDAGQREAAEAGFRRAAELAPKWSAPEARLGVIYQLEGKEQEARDQYALVQAASLDGAGGTVSCYDATQRSQVIANEAYVIYLVNEARLKDGKSILVPDTTLGVIARAHSDEMRGKCYFDHNSPTCGLEIPQDRFRVVFGYKPRCIGENIARRWGSLYSLSAEKMARTHVDLMNSPGPRENILYPTFEWLGIGISVNPHGDYWLTEEFVESGRADPALVW